MFPPDLPTTTTIPVICALVVERKEISKLYRPTM